MFHNLDKKMSKIDFTKNDKVMKHLRTVPLVPLVSFCIFISKTE